MTSKVTLPEFRISQAALGRRLASVILKAREAELNPAEFAATVCAVFERCVSDEFTPEADSPVDETILNAESEEIAKSARRSRAARQAAERRRKMREQKATANDATEVTAVPDESPESSTNEENTVSTETNGSGKKRRRRRRNRRR